MTLNDELAAFYQQSGFGDEIGKRSLTVPVYTGCLLVPLPNIETRRRFLKYHDLHHLITGYGVGRIGEGEVSAWELGSGSMRISPLLGTMNLIALSTGLLLAPKRMWAAYLCGCNSDNLYPAATRIRIDNEQWESLSELRQAMLNDTKPDRRSMLDSLAFPVYACAALVIHATIAIPAVITRVVTELTLGKSFIQAIRPVKRTDLY